MTEENKLPELKEQQPTNVTGANAATPPVGGNVPAATRAGAEVTEAANGAQSLPTLQEQNQNEPAKPKAEEKGEVDPKKAVGSDPAAGEKQEQLSEAKSKKNDKESKSSRSTDPRTVLATGAIVVIVLVNVIVVGVLVYFLLIADHSQDVTGEDLGIEQVDQASLDAARQQFEIRNNSNTSSADYSDIVDPFRLDNETPSVIEPDN